MTDLVILGGRKRAASLIEFACDNGIKVVGVSPMHLYEDEEGENDIFLEMAKKQGVEIVDPDIFSKKEVDNRFGQALIVCENWRKLIPDAWSKKTIGVWVFHESMLPRYRGFAPLAWHILNGEKEFGVTLFHAAGKMDAGDIISQEAAPIMSDDTCGDLYEKSIEIYKRLLKKGVDDLQDGVKPTRQKEEDATYTVPLVPEDAKIDWNMPVETIFKIIRAWAKPYSGAWCRMDDKKLYIWSASPYPDQGKIVGRVSGRVVRIPGKKISWGVCARDGVVVIDKAGFEGEKEREWSFKSLKVTLK